MGPCHEQPENYPRDDHSDPAARLGPLVAEDVDVIAALSMDAFTKGTVFCVSDRLEEQGYRPGPVAAAIRVAW
jgi:hypothetical protein